MSNKSNYSKIARSGGGFKKKLGAAGGKTAKSPSRRIPMLTKPLTGSRVRAGRAVVRP